MSSETTEAERLIEIWEAFDDFDGAAQGMLVAQPHQMTTAAERLDRARKNMRSLLMDLSRPSRRIVSTEDADA
jgi:hypothetical protein